MEQGKNLSLTTRSIVFTYGSAFLLLDLKPDITLLLVFQSDKNLLVLVNLQQCRIQQTTEVLSKTVSTN